MRNQSKPHRLYHFHRIRYISANVNDCTAVDKEKDFTEMIEFALLTKQGKSVIINVSE